MGVSIRIDVNKRGVGQLLKSDDFRYDLLQRGQAIADNAGDGYAVVSGVGFDRAFCIVRTDTSEARRDEAINHTLLRSLHAGGGW